MSSNDDQDGTHSSSSVEGSTDSFSHKANDSFSVDDSRNIRSKAPATKRTKTLSDALCDLLPTTNKKESPSTAASLVLARRKAPARKLAEARLEAAAKKLVKREHRKSLLSIHDDLLAESVEQRESFLNRERGMRKTACRGVVSIFNAVRERQEAKDAAIRVERERKRARLDQMAAASAFHKNGSGLVGTDAVADESSDAPAASQIIKNSFLELLKTSMSVQAHQKTRAAFGKQ